MASLIMTTLEYLNLQKPVKIERVVRVKAYLLPIFVLVIERFRRIQGLSSKYSPLPSPGMETGACVSVSVCACSTVAPQLTTLVFQFFEF